ncbi:sensor histidine kinase [Tabrizicola thermarum]|uniref:sensor histidine kinase n=1 Tax=Tabrizicola thermarum TaxID=2670345 RepID=UPI000FFC2BD4|nr:sensor histidine kinase [Tabrizicola thermarum]
MIGRWKSFLSNSSLGVRLGSTIIIALLPLGALSILQTRDALDQIDQSTLKGVGGAALQSVREQIEVIKEAQVSARVLASVLARPSIGGGPSCMDQVTAIARDIPQATLVAYVPKSGLLTCSSDGRVHDLSADPAFRQMISLPVPGLVYDPHSSISNRAILGVRHPVFDADGVLTGFVVISLAYSTISPSAYGDGDSVAEWNPEYLATLTSGGEVLVSSAPDVRLQQAVPGIGEAPEFKGMTDTARFVETPDGRRIVSVVPIARDLFLLSVWKQDSASFWTNAAIPYTIPALTWMAALAAAAFASSRLVVRHVRALARSMSDYVTSRKRVLIPDISGAPHEIQRLYHAYESLIRTIEQEEAELQNLLLDKDTLLREIDHRSGNSLQIMASVMRMYRRETTDPELRRVLDGLINRVIALSSTHTSLYAMAGRQDIAVDMVLSNVVKRLKEIHGVGLGVANKQFQPVRMDAQSAVPLALALAETVGCYFSRPGLTEQAVLVSLSEADGKVHLRVEGPVVPELLPGTTSGLSALPQRMLRQFAAQLGGTVSLRRDGEVITVELAFPRQPT